MYYTKQNFPLWKVKGTRCLTACSYQGEEFGNLEEIREVERYLEKVLLRLHWPSSKHQTPRTGRRHGNTIKVNLYSINNLFTIINMTKSSETFEIKHCNIFIFAPKPHMQPSPWPSIVLWHTHSSHLSTLQNTWLIICAGSHSCQFSAIILVHH